MYTTVSGFTLFPHMSHANAEQCDITCERPSWYTCTLILRIINNHHYTIKVYNTLLLNSRNRDNRQIMTAILFRLISPIIFLIVVSTHNVMTATLINYSHHSRNFAEMVASPQSRTFHIRGLDHNSNIINSREYNLNNRDIELITKLRVLK